MAKDGNSFYTSFLLLDWFWSPPAPLTPSPPHPSHPPHCDVFLGGSCGSTSWRHDDIIPILRQHGVSFFNPQVSLWDTQLIPVEERAKEQVGVVKITLGMCIGINKMFVGVVSIPYLVMCRGID